MLLLLLGTTLPMRAGGYYVKVQIISKHENGGNAESTANLNNGNKYWVGSNTITINIAPAGINSRYFKEHLIGIYSDPACTQLVVAGGVPTSSNVDWGWNMTVNITQIDESIIHHYSTTTEVDSAEPDVLYALFGYPKVLSHEIHNAIIRDPHAQGVADISYHVANMRYYDDFSGTQTAVTANTAKGINASEFTRYAAGYLDVDNQIWKQTLTYTSNDIHTGSSGDNYAGKVTYRARDRKNSDKNTNTMDMGTIYIYVDLTPVFTLNMNTLTLNWGHDGVNVVNTAVGNEVAASQRSWLQNKLVLKDGTEQNMARNHATWTATIEGTNANQFKFANGTQSVSASAGEYTDDLLDVIYAPTAAGTHTATLLITTSYTDSRGAHLTDSKNISLSGKAIVQSKIEFTAGDHVEASANESYPFGDIIGTNPREVTADLFISNISDATKTWSDPDHAFEFDIDNVDLTSTFQTLTFRAHRATPVAAATNHTATLTISGKDGNNDPISAVLTLTYQALPLLPTTVTWNWDYLDEYTTTGNPLTTNSDGEWTLLPATDNKVIYDAETKQVTTPWLHHERGVKAAFAISIPQTDTYEAFVADTGSTIQVTPPPTVEFNSEEIYNQYKLSEGGFVSYQTENNVIHYGPYGSVNFSWEGQNLVEFDLTETTPAPVYVYYQKTGSVETNLFGGILSAGHHKFLIPHDANKMKISWTPSSGSFDLYNLRFCEYDRIDTRYTQVPLVRDGDAISSLEMPVTFANKQQVTVSLNATAAQYFELQSTGKETGASIVFNESDGLAIRDTIMKTITVAFKADANAADAQQAALGNGCTVTFSDGYTYKHEEHTLPIQVLSPSDITYKHSANGSYTVTYLNETPQVVSDADFVKHITSGDPSAYVVTLSAPTPASGYLFRGWKIDGNLVSYRSTMATSIGKTCEVEAVFVPTEAQNFRVGDAFFADLTEAITAVQSVANDSVVTVAQDVVLGDGATSITYTIPAHVTLLVPHKANFFELQETPQIISPQSNAEVLAAYRTLTLTEGVTINCYGNICVAGKLLSTGGGNKSAYTTGECGVINMVQGGHIELNDGAQLYCWGYIKGQDMDQGNNTVGTGTVTANAGSTVWENFELGDWRGGTASMDIYHNNVVDHRKLFPFQSYAIQNIEIPTSFKYGSTLRTYTSITTGFGDHEAVFKMISNENTMFLLQDEQSMVRTWYDPTTDLTCYELSGTAQLDALHIVVYIEMSSEDFILPICNSMHIILKDCNMTLSNPLMQQAGSIIEIKPDATANLESELYMYDKDQWGKYVHNYYFRSFGNLTSHKNRGAENSKAGLDDAKLIVDGVFNVQNGGKLYTTAGGANIMGNGGGEIHFKQALPDPTILWAVTVLSGKPYIEWENNPVAAANLCNEDGSYTPSTGGKTYYNIHGRWFIEDDKDPQPDHTYDFRYLDNGNTGDEELASAVYSHDKTGLEARMKWFNVVRTADNCTDVEDDLDHPFTSNWWIDTLATPRVYYNYTMLNDWHQFMPAEGEGIYSGSNNVLYHKDECTVTEEGYIDENCLYTFSGVKKALVNGAFIPLTANGYDPAYHATANASQYYICFTGCNWHPATPYAGESKAYTINPETGVYLHYIWFNNDWLNVLRDEPFFYTEDEVTNVRTYYEYINGEWEVATPYVSVSDAAETRTFYMIKEAFNVAQIKKDATIKLLRDLPNVPEVLSYTTQNTTCTLDLNGHLLAGNIANLITVNAPGATFTITDNSDLKNGKISNTASKAVYVQKGTLVVTNGTIESTSTYAIDGATTTAITINGGYFAAGTQCVHTTGTGTYTISGGHFNKEAGLANHLAAHKYAFETTDPKYRWEVSDVCVITFKNGETTLQTLYLHPGETPVYTANEPTKDNQHFIGWNPMIVAATADAIYQAQFEAIGDGKSRVTLNSNGGNEGLQYVYVTTGSAIGTVPVGTTKDGYTFAGWWTEQNGGTQMTAETTISADITYYAHYTKASFTLTWDANGGNLSGDYTQGTVEFGAAITAPTATKDGHTFLRWTPAVAATMPAANTTYTAQWSIVVKHVQQNLDGTYGDPYATEEVSGESGAYVTPAVKTYDGFISPATQTVQIGVDAEVTYQYERRTYTIALDANGGTCATASINVKHGATPVLPVATKNGGNCSGWFTKAIGGDQITNETAILYNIGTLYAQYADLNVTAPLTVTDTREVTDVRITTTGSLNITGDITANNFILESDGSTASGQFVSGYENLHFTHAYFDLKLNAKNHQWYAVAVPWPVDAQTGISVNGRVLTLGTDFDIIYYNGARRASEGKQKCWNYVEDDGDKTLVPGRLYMIGLMSDAQTVRFEKTTGALSTNTTSVTAHASGEPTDAGWNGVANPALFHAYVNPGTAFGQVYVPDEKRYEPITLSDAKLVVGEGAFVQAPATDNDIHAVTSNPFSAPRRTRAQANLTYDVRIAPAEADYTDRLFIKTMNDKEADTYTVGQDLAKVGVSSIVPQMWINRYDAKLCVNTAELTNETAEYPLGISVPANGEYTISNVNINDAYTLYLTLNGEAIWNLSDAPYTLDLTKGTTNAYGLRISAKAPQVVTGVDEAVVDAKGETQKVLINNHVFIIRGNEVYTIDGQLVK